MGAGAELMEAPAKVQAAAMRVTRAASTRTPKRGIAAAKEAAWARSGAAGLAGCSALGRDSRGEGGQGGPGDGQRSRGARAGALRGPARRGAAAGVDAGTEAGAPVARPAAVGAYVPPAARAPGAHLRARRPALPLLADGL